MKTSQVAALKLAVALDFTGSRQSFLALGLVLLAFIFGEDEVQKASKVIDDLPEDTSPIGLLAAIEQELSKGLKKEVH